MWVGFTAFVVVMLMVDLGFLNRNDRELRMREAFLSSVMWIALALLFNAGIAVAFGKIRALEFLTGYIIEKSLSIDNIFVFLLIFTHFHVSRVHQRRILFWGILGALVMRGVFILAGAAMLQRFEWIMYVFGAFLVFTGVKILLDKEEEKVDPDKNPILRLFKKLFPVAFDHDGHFFVRRAGKFYVTPLLLVLVVIETTDLVFAVDSIPAIFAVSRDPFIVYTSNIFAILGLRALFFLLAGAMESFAYLKVGLGLVLAFVGTKMLINGFYPISILLSLAVVGVCLGAAVLCSIVYPPKTASKPAHPHH